MKKNRQIIVFRVVLQDCMFSKQRIEFDGINCFKTVTNIQKRNRFDQQILETQVLLNLYTDTETNSQVDTVEQTQHREPLT